MKDSILKFKIKIREDLTRLFTSIYYIYEVRLKVEFFVEKVI